MTPLPDLHEGWLDDETIRRVLDDLAACAEVLEVRLKAAAERHADAAPLSLDRARAAFLDGHARGLQVHYRFGGDEWTDTLLRSGQGVRLVRMRHPPTGAPSDVPPARDDGAPRLR